MLDVVLLEVNLGMLEGGLGLLVGGLGLLVGGLGLFVNGLGLLAGGLGLAKPDGGGLSVGSGRCLSVCCVSEALVTGRMKTAKPVMGQPAETGALLFCCVSLSDPETQQQHEFFSQSQSHEGEEEAKKRKEKMKRRSRRRKRKPKKSSQCSLKSNEQMNERRTIFSVRHYRMTWLAKLH